MRLIKTFYIKKLNLCSLCRQLIYFILIFSLIVSIGNAKVENDRFSHRNNSNRSATPSNTKYNSHNEISVSKPHHHIRHEHSHHNNRTHHPIRPLNYNHQHNDHQSSDSASYGRLPVTQKPIHSKFYSKDNAAARNPADQQRSSLHHHNRLAQSQPQKSRQYNRMTHKDAAYRTDPFSSQSESSGYAHSYGSHRHRVTPFTKNTKLTTSTEKASTTTTTTTTTSTTTLAPILFNNDKTYFDSAKDWDMSGNENEDDDDDDDYDEDDDDEYTDNSGFKPNAQNNLEVSTINRQSGKFSPKMNPKFYENIQRDDPIRSGRSPSSNSNIRNTATTLMHSANVDNYMTDSNVNSNGNMNKAPTMQTSRDSTDDVKTNSTMRDFPTRVSV